MQYQQTPQYGYPAQQPQPQQQYFESAPGHGAPNGYGAPPMQGYEQPMQYEQQPMQYEQQHQVQYEQVQYVQAPQGYYAEPPSQIQQQFASGPQLIQQQPVMQQTPPMHQQPQYAAAPQPSYQQPLGNGGKGKLVKAGRYWPGKWLKLIELEKPVYEIDLLRNQQRGAAPPPPNQYFEEGSSGEAL